MQELELLEAELHAATREPLSADPFLLYLYGLVLSDRFVSSRFSLATQALTCDAAFLHFQPEQ